MLGAVLTAFPNTFDNDLIEGVDIESLELTTRKGAGTLPAPLIYDFSLHNSQTESDFGFPAWFVVSRP